ncbi:DUF7691 family protein [Streptomyces sp. H27-D2]|uniref:DUF7691 family protein n=1 Tax=Streptomyces sp. H27-D2 TaxID=3046304 RepID=UPI002DB5CC01|nr:hypothetical protein [Streptomyces sp. H27-D2]MEC4016368.1 hypothetical protein [Streptomyces sp. H27-D2]
MSHIISMNTADQSRILAYLQGGELTADQQRVLEYMRVDARTGQAELDRQDLDWDITVPDALEELITGRADADGECAGNAYYTALQHIIASNGSDLDDLGVYSKPSTFFGHMDDELRRLGVPADLCPHQFLYAGPPDGVPFHIPYPMDGYPAIGRLPLAKAKAVADAYRAVLGRLDDAFAYEAELFIDKMQFEHDEWQTALQHGHTMDTVFFSIQG